jgi:hypothetical protein
MAVDGSLRDDPLVILVARGGEIVWSAPEGLPHPVLTSAVREALLAHRKVIRSVVAARGPGSYMGIRSALAAALGAAQSLALPIALVGSLEVVAAQCDPGTEPVLALADAGRGGTFGQVLVPEPGDGKSTRWRARGRAALLARDVPWPGVWEAPSLAVGTVGEGRRLPGTTRLISPVRDRRMALAWLVAEGLTPISGYDRITADYPDTVGAR